MKLNFLNFFSSVPSVAPREEPNLSFIPPKNQDNPSQPTLNEFMPPPSFIPGRHSNFNNDNTSNFNLGNGKEVKVGKQIKSNTPQTNFFFLHKLKLNQRIQNIMEIMVNIITIQKIIIQIIFIRTIM